MTTSLYMRCLYELLRGPSLADGKTREQTNRIHECAFAYDSTSSPISSLPFHCRSRYSSPYWVLLNMHQRRCAHIPSNYYMSYLRLVVHRLRNGWTGRTCSRI
ncbi:hypothetical protein AMTRI_Chr10g3690 [Amborella trichopoda]